ncbi:MAG: endopeptidase La [Deltaproteobacteria bacterium]|nr:endopeptidase La [Deltaproteobacteria bacterium]
MAEKVIKNPYNVPFIPLRDLVIFPYTTVSILVGRRLSIESLEVSRSSIVDKNKIILTLQKNPDEYEPTIDTIHTVGVIGNIINITKTPEQNNKIVVEVLKRCKINSIYQDSYWSADIEEIPITYNLTSENEIALVDLIRKAYAEYVTLLEKPKSDIPPYSLFESEPERALYLVAHSMNIKSLKDKQFLIEEITLEKRLEKLYEIIEAEIDIINIEKKIKQQVKKQIEKNQREYYLREQIDVINKELGIQDDYKADLQELEQIIKNKSFTPEARERAEKELAKLKMMPPSSAEATVVRNYLDLIISLPFTEMSEEKKDIKEAKRILDEDHYGLDIVKEKILDYLAVRQLSENPKMPILCLIGPPGVGKTSLGKSIARATGRNFVRISLGGVRDEAEIRGHRRTYIGALPGKIIAAMKKAKTINPVFMIDEIDKLAQDYKGDPAAALLEVLDPEQNNSFHDHYLDFGYDLSKILFITTANNIETIPLPLLDRMEVVRIPGYTDYEKLHIAKQFLIPRQKKFNGLEDFNIIISDETIYDIIHLYTREAGVRNLEREIGNIMHKLARQIVENGVDNSKKERFEITIDNLKNYLGIPKFTKEDKPPILPIGVATGLAWTSSGGEVLFIEVISYPGKGNIAITGKLGDVMKESAQAAFSYVKAISEHFGISITEINNRDYHIHIPEGATPKDGPSAGITIACALLSNILGVPLRNDTALTGEITLSGRILPIGGLKEKALAAYRNNIFRIIIPLKNKKDIEEIPEEIKKAIKFITTTTMEEVILEAFDRKAILEIATKNSGDFFHLKDVEATLNREKTQEGQWENISS